MEETRIRTVVAKKTPVKSLDIAVFFTYLCSSLVMNLPILLLPMAAAEHATGRGVSTLVVRITSIAIMGGGLGKFVNGFVCQEMGAKRSSVIYLVGSAVCSVLFSLALPHTLGWVYAGIEFFISMQWTALSVVFAQHYEGNAAGFAAAITVLSLASTCGQLLAKFVGMTLLQYFHWRTVARLGAVVALVGSCIVGTFVTEPPASVPSPQKSFQWKSMAKSMQTSARTVLSNPLFWAVGCAHAMAMVARSSDRILGEFFSHATDLPSELHAMYCVVASIL
jgi:sugar phosphate permease